MEHFFAMAGVAVMSGLYTCCWGAYKDGPYEGFSASTFPRSILFSLAILGGFLASPLTRAAVLSLTPFALFFFLMGIERAWVEIYKGCFRPVRRAELFAIPQEVTALGKKVDRPWVRPLIGVFLTLFLVGGVHATIASPARTLPFYLLTAFCTGLGVSVGGAYKDAPFEGFQPFKFFRSSLVLVAIAPVVHRYSPMPIGLLVFVFVGVERTLVEYYKSFIVRSVPGKFRPDLPIVEGAYLKRRPLFRAGATLIVLAVLVQLGLEQLR